MMQAIAPSLPEAAQKVKGTLGLEGAQSAAFRYGGLSH